ncbi:MAG TPA: hypothetical protein VMK12_17650 [Anaeromyxobacteraceae bacterium]|nr:hypothetical protein [Anaeromyxobacteraceae bacterium]
MCDEVAGRELVTGRPEVGHAHRGAFAGRLAGCSWTGLAHFASSLMSKIWNASAATSVGAPATGVKRSSTGLPPSLDRPRADNGYGSSTGIAIIKVPARPFFGPVFEKYADADQASRRFLERVAKNLGGDFG